MALETVVPAAGDHVDRLYRISPECPFRNLFCVCARPRDRQVEEEPWEKKGRKEGRLFYLYGGPRLLCCGIDEQLQGDDDRA